MLLRYAILGRWARLVCDHPLLTVSLSVLLAALSLGLTATRLTFQSDRSDLVDPALGWQKRYADYKRDFPDWNDLTVVVAADDPAAEPFADALAAVLRQDPLVGEVNNGFAADKTPPGLIFSRTIPEIRQFLQEQQTNLQTPTPASPNTDSHASAHTNSDSASTPDTPSTVPSPPTGAPVWQHLRTPSGRLILLQVSGKEHNTDENLLSAVRRHIQELKQQTAFAGISAGVTGVPAMEMDESTQSIGDSTKASILAFLLISTLAVVVYRGFVVPIMAVASLLIGVAWSFGYLTLVVGHLQLLSVVFAVILLGLGIDTAIHLIARLELTHPDHDHLEPAVERVFRGIGPGVLTGSMTTAAAFFTSALTDFKGVAEMGIIAAGGVILCTIAVMSVFPALLMLIRQPEKKLLSRHGGENRPFMRGKLDVLSRHAGVTVTVAVIIFALLGASALRVRYDPDLMKLQPDNLESVQWEKKLAELDADSFWHAIIGVHDIRKAEEITHRLNKLQTVDHVGGAGILFPENVEEKRALLAQLPPPISSRAQAPLPTLDDLPEALKRRFTGENGLLLLYVYPRSTTEGVLSPEKLNPFVEDVLRVAPQATGPAVQIYESTRLITRAYIIAATLAAGMVFILLLIDFRSLWNALSAMLPVILGFAGTFGVMSLTGVSLNFANVMTMPLILGLGVDCGVHAVHRWLMQPASRPRGLAGGTGRAITLTTLTTAIGFACMMTAKHKGIQSLGFVMVVALTLTWAATVFVLPSVLALRKEPEATS